MVSIPVCGGVDGVLSSERRHAGWRFLPVLDSTSRQSPQPRASNDLHNEWRVSPDLSERWCDRWIRNTTRCHSRGLTPGRRVPGAALEKADAQAKAPQPSHRWRRASHKRRHRLANRKLYAAANASTNGKRNAVSTPVPSRADARTDRAPTADARRSRRAAVAAEWNRSVFVAHNTTRGGSPPVWK